MLSKVKKRFESFLYPLTEVITGIGLKPNHITIIACFLGIISAYVISLGRVIEAVILFTISGFFDVLDGAIAKNHKMITKIGEFLDSVCDRIVDGSILIGIGIYSKEWLLVSLAIVFSVLVSYTRAKGEKLIEKCDVGIMERSERIIVLLVGLLFGLIKQALIILIVLSFITVLQRIWYVKKSLKN